jgi:hypothetical protein
MNEKGLKYQAYWKQHVDAYRHGALTKEQYCKTHQLKYHRFGYWLQKFKLNADLVPIKVKPVTRATVVSGEASDVLCTLRLQQGMCLQIHDVKGLSAILSLVGSHAV